MNKIYFLALICLVSLVSKRAFACEGACPGPIETVSLSDENGGSDGSEAEEASGQADTLADDFGAPTKFPAPADTDMFAKSNARLKRHQEYLKSQDDAGGWDNLKPVEGLKDCRDAGNSEDPACKARRPE